MAAWWAASLHCDTNGNSGRNGNSYTLTIPEQSIFVTAALSGVYINSSGGDGNASIESYQIQQPNGPSAQIPVGANIMWEFNVVSVTFQVWCDANPAGFGFNNGSNATGIFTITDWP
jgi:hypothetical protein